ncbi:MAG: glycosyltransferase, partial [Planctomycetaceae bacterium]|nr:glycosyltransferase [Planctomycetaceae bacterium]
GEMVADFDIGIMPLFADQEWDKFKCPTKITQYMACGLPSVASPVGFTAEVTSHGVEGFHAATTAEWVVSLTNLIDSADLRQKMGRAAREKAVNVFSVEANSPKMLDVIRRAAEISGG